MNSIFDKILHRNFHLEISLTGFFQNIFFIFIVLGVLGIIFSKTTFHGVLNLIFTFVVGGIWITEIGSSFLGILLIMIHACTIAIFFLFTIMLIGNEEEHEFKTNFSKKLSAFSFLKYFGISIYSTVLFLVFYYLPEQIETRPWAGISFEKTSEFFMIAKAIYEDNFIVFQCVALILLVAVVATGLLVRKEELKTFSIEEQINHISAVELIPNTNNKLNKFNDKNKTQTKNQTQIQAQNLKKEKEKKIGYGIEDR